MYVIYEQVRRARDQEEKDIVLELVTVLTHLFSITYRDTLENGTSYSLEVSLH